MNNKFYIYTLSDPRDGEIFYVGKGCGDRLSQHEKDCRNGRVNNAHKHLRIQSIIGSGHRVQTEIVQSGLTEPESFSAERRLIQQIGFANLTNVSPGEYTAIEKSKAIAQVALGRLKSRKQWLCERPRSAAEIALADRVVAELDYIARHGQISEVIVYRDGVEFR